MGRTMKKKSSRPDFWQSCSQEPRLVIIIGIATGIILGIAIAMIVTVAATEMDVLIVAGIGTGAIVIATGIAGTARSVDGIVIDVANSYGSVGGPTRRMGRSLRTKHENKGPSLTISGLCSGNPRCSSVRPKRTVRIMPRPAFGESLSPAKWSGSSVIEASASAFR
jgi:hypothetical protein